MSEEQRLLHEILALQREMAEEIRKIRSDLARAQAAPCAPAAHGQADPADGIKALARRIGEQNLRVEAAARSGRTQNRRKP
ncbi:hypothetical protein dsx2_2251 [Desulfovibrio sp. X2]|uniref:hypothetical protein n=1 Tax=Desulfovibrio sp. X2 TaxID=941449 RepID=UPI000358CBCC|nr:hypothetical protein [Desulfovibrio sp. X2]EPR43634.1 hypothetical protein dsx2_2251 [Desulfovibrio sp. X2]